MTTHEPASAATPASATTHDPASAATREPCGNEDCDKCYPLPRFKISTERVQRLFYERTIKAATAEEALRTYNEGTAWPSSYDDRGGEVLERKEPVVSVVQSDKGDKFDAWWLEQNCWHNLRTEETEAFLAKGVETSLASCDFVGDLGCSDTDCPRCHPKVEDYVWPT